MQEKIVKINPKIHSVGKEEIYTCWFMCPNCGTEYIADWFKYCPICGDKIIWEDTYKKEE